MALDERKLKILEAVVNTYVRTGEPVGSKTICEILLNTVSSATIRNEMVELSERGLLEQPHTSAGRIPSKMGYRVYISHMMKKQVLTENEKLVIDSMLAEGAHDPEKLLKNASQTLALLTNYSAITTTPNPKRTIIRSVQVMPVGRRSLIVVLMTSSGTVKNKLCVCDFDVTNELLRIVSHLFREKLIGRPLHQITLAYLQTLVIEIGEFAFLVSPILKAVLEIVQEASFADVYIYGESNLLAHRAYTDSEIRRLLNLLSKKAELTGLLNEHDGDLRILIGEEAVTSELLGSSMIISRYKIADENAGAIAVVGPTRMDYAKISAYLLYVSEAVGTMLSGLLKNE